MPRIRSENSWTRKIFLYDDDLIEEHNQPASFFALEQLGMSKVDAVQENVTWLNGIEIEARPERYRRQRIETPVLVIAVDTARERRNVWLSVKENWVPPVEFVIDVASGMNMIRIEPFAADDDEKYLAGFEGEEWQIPCSGRSVAYNSFVAAGLTAAIVKCWALGQPYPSLFELDMATWYNRMDISYEEFLDGTP